MKKMITILLLSIAFSSFGQSKSIVIKIDSLVLKNGGNNQIEFDVKVDRKVWYKSYSVELKELDSTIIQGYVQRLENLSDTSELNIPIDNYGSRIVLVNKNWSNGDTITITKVVVYNRLEAIIENCRTEIYNPRKEKYTIVEQYSFTRQFDATFTLKFLSIIINKVPYSIQLKDCFNDYTKRYCGTIKGKSLYKKIKYGFKVLKFTTSCRSKYYTHEALIKL